MLRFLFATTLALTAMFNCNAGYFEFTASSYTANLYVGVIDNNAGTSSLAANDIVQTVQRFQYIDKDLNTRTALAITIAEVAATPPTNSSQSYTFGTAASGSGIFSIDNFISNGTWTSGALDATGASSTGNTFALLTAAGSISLSASGFDFTNTADFGLADNVWSVDMVAGLDGSGSYYDIRHGDISAGIYVPLGESGTGNTIFNIGFAQTITQVYDEAGTDYTAGDPLGSQSFQKIDGTSTIANLGTTTTAGSTLVYGSVSGAPLGTVYYASNVAVSLPAPGAVPEPASLATFLGLTVSLMASRRRKKA